MSGLSQHGPHGAWTVAARYGDADAEEHGLMECLRRQGIDTEAFQHVADQRALRNVLMRRPGFDPRVLDSVGFTQLDPMERAAHAAFMVAYYDGLYIGWRARGLVEGGTDADSTDPRHGGPGGA